MVNPQYKRVYQKKTKYGAKKRVKLVMFDLFRLKYLTNKSKPRVIRSCKKVSLSPATINGLKFSYISQKDNHKNSQQKTLTKTCNKTDLINNDPWISDPTGLFTYIAELILLNQLCQNIIHLKKNCQHNLTTPPSSDLISN